MSSPETDKAGERPFDHSKEAEKERTEDERQQKISEDVEFRERVFKHTCELDEWKTDLIKARIFHEGQKVDLTHAKLETERLRQLYLCLKSYETYLEIVKIHSPDNIDKESEKALEILGEYIDKKMGEVH